LWLRLDLFSAYYIDILYFTGETTSKRGYLASAKESFADWLDPQKYVEIYEKNVGPTVGKLYFLWF